MNRNTYLTFNFQLSAFNLKQAFSGLVRRTIIISFALVITSALTGCRDKPPPNLVNRPEEVSGKKIGVIEGSPSVMLAEELGTAMAYPSGSELMYHLISGLLDCVIMENSVASELVSETSGVRILTEPLLKYDLRFAVAKENAELLAAVNSALDMLRANGTLGGLRDMYFSGKKYVYIPPDDVQPRPGSLSLAVPPDSAPYSYVAVSGDFCGLDIDVARAVCDRLGVDLQIIWYEARELVTSVWYGKADLALGWIPVEGDDKVAVSEPYADAVLVIIVRR